MINGSVRLGIVGCGAIVRRAHLPVIVSNRQVEVTVLCDRDRRNALVMQREFGLTARVTDSLADLAGKVDAAIVAVPPRFHAPVATQLLDMGIDVLCEKPLATRTEDAHLMAASARRNGRILAVALMMRYFPHNQWLQRLVDAGEIGTVREVRVEDGAPLDWPMASNSYFDAAVTGGGVLFDSGVHLLDRVVWLFGELDDLEYRDDGHGGFESSCLLRGTLTIARRPVPATMEFSWSHTLRRSIRVIGTAGELEARTAAPRHLTLRKPVSGTSLEMEVVCAPHWGGLSHYRAQLEDFVEAVRDRRPPFITAESAIRALAVIERAYAQRQPLSEPWVEHQRKLR